MPCLRSAGVLAVVLSITGCAHLPASRAASPSDAERASLVATAERWWQDVAHRDSAAVGAGATDDLRVTLASGRTYDRAQFLKAVADFEAGPSSSASWTSTDVRRVGDAGAVFTGRSAETGPAGTVDYWYQVVFVRAGDAWRVTRSLSSRVPALTPRIPLAQAGRTSDFLGAYRAPRGGALRVSERDGVLILADPTGGESRLEPIAPGVFELNYVTTSSGTVRFVFTRDESGRVTGLTRLGAGVVVTWPRQ